MPCRFHVNQKKPRNQVFPSHNFPFNPQNCHFHQPIPSALRKAILKHNPNAQFFHNPIWNSFKKVLHQNQNQTGNQNLQQLQVRTKTFLLRLHNWQGWIRKSLESGTHQDPEQLRHEVNAKIDVKF